MDGLRCFFRYLRTELVLKVASLLEGIPYIGARYKGHFKDPTPFVQVEWLDFEHSFAEHLFTGHTVLELLLYLCMYIYA